MNELDDDDDDDKNIKKKVILKLLDKYNNIQTNIQPYICEII